MQILQPMVSKRSLPWPIKQEKLIEKRYGPMRNKRENFSAKLYFPEEL
jgi:hypothetical protein